MAGHVHYLMSKGNGPPISTLKASGQGTRPHLPAPDVTYLPVKASLELVQNIGEIIEAAQSQISKAILLHSLVSSNADNSLSTLHLSLSRPLQLWTGQRAGLAAAVRSALRHSRKFKITLATLTRLTNDEKTRSFLTCGVGYGYEELTTMTESLNSILARHRLPPYYAEPRFHVSVAWWTPMMVGSSWENKEGGEDRNGEVAGEDLTTVALQELEARFGQAIRKHELEVDCVMLKMGKDVTSIVNRLRVKSAQYSGIGYEDFRNVAACFRNHLGSPGFRASSQSFQVQLPRQKPKLVLQYRPSVVAQGRNHILYLSTDNRMNI
ncbi:MAG: poly(U)-specific 3'-to-5' RNA exonuclease [Cyphobasidiales sp. Tagirdzhanova-0007]|nr:MAG: poly(U)-specific 3'-to-5' RNA exonuclease [Cyphobasidiales sp. Tagirdzhanova-0007]